MTFYSYQTGEPYTGTFPKEIEYFTRLEQDGMAVYAVNTVKEGEKEYQDQLERKLFKEGFLWYETPPTQASEGGAGSGNFGHSGIQGQQGGSIGRGVRVGRFTDEEKNNLKSWNFLNLPTEGKLLDGLKTVQVEKGASQVKDEVVNAISHKADNMTYEQANDLVATWAHTSNDNDPMSLQLQAAAAEHFGTELSDWQKGNKEGIDAVSDIAREYRAEKDKFYEAMRNDDVEAQNASWEKMQLIGDRFDKETERWGVGYTNDFGEVEMGFDVDEFSSAVAQADRMPYDDFVQTNYEGTQEYFKEQGYSPDDEILLYRGFSSDQQYFEGDAEYIGNTLESWSLSPTKAAVFGDVVIAVKVPISGIFSTPLTGIGCLGESELVIKGGVMPVYVVKGNALNT